MTKTNTHTKINPKTKKVRNSSVPVLMYIGYNALWLMFFVHLETKTKAKTKTKTKTCSRDLGLRKRGPGGRERPSCFSCSR